LKRSDTSRDEVILSSTVLMAGLEALVATLEVGDGREEMAVVTIERVVRAEDMVKQLRMFENVEG
jgi:hypothetical protein